MDCKPTRLLCSWGLSRQEYWSGLPFLSPGDFPDPEVKPGSPALQENSLPSEPSGKTKLKPHKWKLFDHTKGNGQRIHLNRTKQSESQSVMSDSLQPHGLYSPWNSPSQDYGVSSLSLLQGIFSTQASNPGLPYCRQILYQLSHEGSPRILGLPNLGIELESPALQIGFFTN